MLKLNQSYHWGQLQQLLPRYRQQHLRELFAEPGNRFERYSLEVDNILLDYSKNCITEPILTHLFGLTRDMNLPAAVEAMFRGELINKTEQRAVLHTALRNRSNVPVMVNQTDVMPAINTELQRMRLLVEQVRNGDWVGYSGKSITDVVNIGIGGSNLGPRMVTEALRAYADDRIRVHFISNVDGADISRVLASVSPEQVLFVVASKTFTTTETMLNAHTARNWLLAATGEQIALKHHFIAVSSNRPLVKAFGIAPENIFTLWDWVGGRYSLWSAIGLPIAIYLGFAQFEALLSGAYAMDQHFRYQPLEQNAPVILALVGIWNSLLLQAQTRAILPYDAPLASFPAYIQQADMESNGKHVDRQGQPVDYATGPIIWGHSGMDGQHSFYQFLHQGQVPVPADFIGSVASSVPLGNHHEQLVSNCFAQSEALMNGMSEVEAIAQLKAQGMDATAIAKLAPHKIHAGNRPSNTLLLQRLEPRSLGALIALYEHKIMVQGVLWDICSFDQWGVELGKTLAQAILAEITSTTRHSHDDSTRGLIDYFKAARQP